MTNASYVLAVLILSSASAWAQDPVGAIEGSIADTSKGTVAGSRERSQSRYRIGAPNERR